MNCLETLKGKTISGDFLAAKTIILVFDDVTAKRMKSANVSMCAKESWSEV